MIDSQPVGIIRTIPIENEVMHRTIKRLMVIDEGWIYFSLTGKPKIEVLYLYVITAGRVKYRFNIAGYEPGDSRMCWDGVSRCPRIWAICTAPMEAPAPISMKGFQGFRYTTLLW